ncbi:hypothetical protein I7I50_08219 [Histoplasma capsulatum G186AR]|uniref:Uncharacterized protein n=1 Tax=Ajellomyces capsulatus TaxID=5037 RepID=A0A8H8CZ41_AJECA|nr:hypothetical protein I7I52_05736 [Histoplasma capsulatum]QSS73441.1 hypothetical protein I7I50_08219 [Histoplasma capsulatum G186AR]
MSQTKGREPNPNEMAWWYRGGEMGSCHMEEESFTNESIYNEIRHLGRRDKHDGSDKNGNMKFSPISATTTTSLRGKG